MVSDLFVLLYQLIRTLSLAIPQKKNTYTLSSVFWKWNYRNFVLIFLARKNCRNLLVVLKSNYPGHTRALRHTSRCYMLYIVPFLGFVVLTVSIVVGLITGTTSICRYLMHFAFDDKRSTAFFLPQNACNLVQFFRKTPFNFFRFTFPDERSLKFAKRVMPFQ